MRTIDRPRATSQRGAPRTWPLDLSRGLAAAGVLVSAEVHFNLWYADGFADIVGIGPMFLLNAIGGLVIGLVLLCWRHWLPALAASGFGILSLGAFALSVTVGLFGLKEVAGGEPQLLAGIAEAVCAVFGLVTAVLLWRTSASRVRNT